MGEPAAEAQHDVAEEPPRWRALVGRALNLLGGRTTLILNLCAVLIAGIVAAERWFVLERVFLGIGADWAYIWPTFLPVAVMFVIRNRYFSSVFLFIYLVLALSGAHEVWLIQADTPMPYPGGRSGLLKLSFLCSRYIAYCSTSPLSQFDCWSSSGGNKLWPRNIR